MADETRDPLTLETTFLSGVESNIEAAKGRLLGGTQWERSEADDEDRLRALMASSRNYDKALLRRLPKNRRVAIHGFERSWFFWRRRTGVAIASVLNPLEHLATGAEQAPPVGLAELTSHVRKLVGDRRVKHVIGICCPSGLTEEARNARLDLPNAEVVLIEPDGHGGWQVRGARDGVSEKVLQLFDPEDVGQKIDRVRETIEEQSADLLTGSLTASSIARKVGLPEHLVRRAFETVSAADPELCLTKKEGEAILYRGAPVAHKRRQSMSVIDRIRQLLSGDGDESEKINLLTERRATLAQRRDRMYEDIAKLEKREAELLEQGRTATSAVPRRRLAAQLSQLRKDIARQNTTAAMLNKQIDIISTDIHNLTLIKQGEIASLPDTQELTEHAVQAEEMLESLRADADMVSSLETGMEESLVSDEEMAILAEFDQPAEEDRVAGQERAAEQASSAQASRASQEPEEAERRQAARPPAEPEPPGRVPPSKNKPESARGADPEAS